ncbi:hypothetical protein CAPTEDRAFT_157003 [Capitella teleta]|uniref:Nucleoporin NUP42 n=1 Tax=Capitella teleta TaxID=283909 RepID=R7UCP4_CAPTE|nr:hypothetical protein CAPTEDRAFT_157003 [Capitella teleta]|eukprot:ELU01558.1 hypothetical protein CAPTEDRAFT_157003 [Capitella teleta]
MSTSSLQRSNSPTRPSDQICRFYRKGICLRGTSCSYLHQSDQNHEAVIATPEAVDPVLDPPQIQQQPKQRKDCHVFRDTGICRFGNSCRYSHATTTDKDEEVKTEKKPVQKPKKEIRICSAFERTGKCRYGEGCRYSHVIPEGTKEDDAKPSTEDKPPTEKSQPKKTPNPKNGDKKKIAPKKAMCRYFRAGNCHQGDKCKFFHPADLPDVVLKNDDQTETAEPKMTRPPRQVFQRTSEYVADVLTDEAAEKLRETEIGAITKRFPRTRKNSDGTLEFTVTASDPDWPYDVNQLRLALEIPGTYPKEKLKCSLPIDERLPDVVRRSVARNIGNWLDERYQKMFNRGKVEIVFRPFIRWLDKNMESLFTEGLTVYQKQLFAEAAGVQFIAAEELQEKFSQLQKSSDEEEEAAVEAPCEEADEVNEPISSSPPKDIVQDASLDPNKRGTEIKLLNLQLKESAAAMRATSIALVIQCGRCKNNIDVKTPPDRTNAVQCPRCQETQYITFRGCMVHPMNSVIGYLDLVNCIAFDVMLSECVFLVSCLACSKDMTLQGLAPGHPKDTWCRNCHEKIRIAVESTRFLVLQPSQTTNSGKAYTIEVKALKKVQKDIAIKLGQPLPENGTCRHYKKSYRWLRFPCCGKAYPCDICHDENEGDHDMKYANRMICGFCCKEQPYASEKPCSGCDSAMTRQASSHWEGGKGCRDKIKMARGDVKKFSGSSKTISRVSQKNEVAKKTVKLRHT